jgi:xanthine dehydrogenase accessory factor
LVRSRRIAAALLTDAAGSTPFAVGASMLIDERLHVDGSITGGCVEAAVAQEAATTLGGGPPRTLRYGVADDVAGEVGLTCGGSVEVFVHELRGTAAEAELALLDAAADGRGAAIATVLDGPSAGDQLALVAGKLIGSLGGGLLERHIARDLRTVLGDATTTLRRYPGGAAPSDELRVLVRSTAPPAQMLIFGATDFGAALATLARELGYVVTIADARASFAGSTRFASVAEVVVAWPDDVLAVRELGPRDAILVFTHDPKFDEPALLGALATRAGYIGALGSRKTTADRSARLRAAGVSDGDLARIHAPCGLGIGASSPAEVAISVLAEIIAARAGRDGGALRDSTEPIHPRRTERR